MADKRILIIDRDQGFRATLSSVLRKRKDIEWLGEATKYEEAIRRTRVSMPNLIFLEASLPDFDQYDVIRDLFSAARQAMIVLLAEEITDSLLLRAILGGVNGLLLKGKELEKMIDALSDLDNDEFLLSPKITYYIIREYSRIRAELENGFILSNLTARERDVLFKIGSGASNREIAKELVISENTVRIHVQNILKKLNLKNRQEVRERYFVALSLIYSGNPSSFDS